MGVLSGREVQVLTFGAAGFTAKETARELYLSIDTIKTHLQRAYAVLGVSNLAHAVTVAHELDLLPMRCCGHTDAPLTAQHRRFDRDTGGLDKAAERQRMAERFPWPSVSQTYPSVTWGEREWFEAFRNDDLFMDILKGIARVSSRRRRA